MIKAVDRLEDAGLIVHQQTRPSPCALYRSRIRPTDRLRALICHLPVAAIGLDPREVVVLRGEDGHLIPYRDTAATRAIRRDVLAHNSFIGDLDIAVRHPDVRQDTQGFLIVGDQRLNPTRTAYHRVFNGRFSKGGRWFGPWWQSLPTAIRAGIRINGEATSEPDIRGCHMRLLGARAGLDFGDGDPYALPDFPRDEIKLAINIMLNARSWASARGALVEELSPRHRTSASRRADAIKAAVLICFPALEPFWNSGYGLTLQYLDADICMRVQRRLRDNNTPCLSIHDSFIVPRTAHDHVEGNGSG
jgi:hypothetical protein